MYCAICGANVAGEEFYCKKCKKKVAQEAAISQPTQPTMSQNVAVKPSEGTYSITPAAATKPVAETNRNAPVVPELSPNQKTEKSLAALVGKLPVIKKGILTNGLIFFGSLMVGLLSYSTEGSRGGTSLVFSGATVYGAIRFFSGIYNYYQVSTAIKNLKQNQNAQ